MQYEPGDSTFHDGSHADEATGAVANSDRRTSVKPETDDDHVADNFIYMFPFTLFLVLATFAAVIAWG